MEYTLGRVGIVVHDGYDPTKTYEALDLVPYQGGSYIAKDETVLSGARPVSRFAPTVNTSPTSSPATRN